MATNGNQVQSESSRNASKIRRNITISEEQTKQLEKMAEEEQRSGSNFINWLIEQEWKRRQLETAAAA